MGGGGRNGVREMGRDGEMGWRVGVIHPSQEEEEEEEKEKKKKEKKKEEDKHHIRRLTYCVMFLVGS